MLNLLPEFSLLTKPLRSRVSSPNQLPKRSSFHSPPQPVFSQDPYLTPVAPSRSRRGCVRWGPRTGVRLRNGTLTLTAAARPKGWLCGGSRAPTHAHSARAQGSGRGGKEGKEKEKRKEVEGKGAAGTNQPSIAQLRGHFLLLLGNRKCPSLKSFPAKLPP